jgi:TRAP-type C4-dicarboxylate transport system permease large subunit
MSPPVIAALCLGIVMTGMVLLTILFYALNLVARRRGLPAPALPPIDPELLVALAAAAAEALAAPVIVHRVHVHRGAAAERWSRAGRMDIMISHRVEPKR